MDKGLHNVNINCDLGEGLENDSDLMPYLHSCNIACGGHYGDAESMHASVKLALRFNVKVGAHPSFPDRENFGRKSMEISLDELKSSIRKQINDFDVVCKSLSVKMHHIKLHGALYNVAAKDEAVAQMVVYVLEDFPEVKLYAPHNSALARCAESKLEVCYEAFIDRFYEDDLSLVHRSKSNAVIESPKDSWAQLNAMLKTNSVTSIHGITIPIQADTFCVHGDNEYALSILNFIDQQLSVLSPMTQPYGDSGVLLSWPKEIRPEIYNIVRSADSLIQNVLKNEIIETVITYQSLVVYLKLGVDRSEVLNTIRGLDLTAVDNQKSESFQWEIPVCYASKFGSDLNELSKEINLTEKEIIALHSSKAYGVYFIGFLPGFLYLGGLPKEIHHPRKAIPSLTVPSGAVGIGGEQTGIYPMESPGGWNIIGQTPVKLFNVEASPPISIQAGDKVLFIPIDEETYYQIALEVAENQYSLTKTKLI
ncbi:MAG: 5-oxoprolinase subunit PxpB [Crocinitomicaceae bacterium]|nr:5-oxoprolinase subunit PxpB [Crocinitomicaceae bacterium]